MQKFTFPYYFFEYFCGCKSTVCTKSNYKKTIKRMKILHLSDLHLGKRVNGFPMLEDQKFILDQILRHIDDMQPQAVIIAGDVYDKSVPAAEAVELLDEFLCELAKRKLQVFVVSGNHDSVERLAFASRLIENSGVHIARVYDGHVKPIVLQDENGPVNIYMMPFVKPVVVKELFPDENISTYTDALSVAVKQMDINEKERNLLVAHQFVTGTKGVAGVHRSDSEDLSVGGLDNVDASAFAQFDYVALGHIHGPQNIDGYDHIRYCGSPLKYSFSEAKHQKSLTVVEFGQKGDLNITSIPLTPKHDMREIHGTYEQLTDARNYTGTATDDYLHVTLTDEQDVVDALAKLRTIYPNIMILDYDNNRTRNIKVVTGTADMTKSPIDIISEFFKTHNGDTDMADEQRKYIQTLIDKIWED